MQVAAAAAVEALIRSQVYYDALVVRLPIVQSVHMPFVNPVLQIHALFDESERSYEAIVTRHLHQCTYSHVGY